MSELMVSGVTYRYERRQSPVLEDVSMRVSRGEIVGILGASGSGKSTLLRLIAGLETPEQGSITLGERVLVNERAEVSPADRGIGMVFQDYALFPHLTTADNIAFGLHRMKRKDRQQRLDEMLDLIQMTDFARRYPHELSGGQQQRVALARALAPGPTLLLMDEPFSSLDAELKQSIRTELRSILQRAGTSCLLVSHDRDDVAAICHRTLYVESGVWRELDSEHAQVDDTRGDAKNNSNKDQAAKHEQPTELDKPTKQDKPPLVLSR
ncbi:ABC transporter ATP-binding protein [Paenibacillus daejeonensis]|uniref:ABC transporter ATP-binding protein n=1 Tax=Paenibacillus daejeonensis TaxID=135193 RepID=UPI00036F75A0|nr:ABC transporter ATP-binding protein [Paenibacillus daejeonensis]